MLEKTGVEDAADLGHGVHDAACARSHVGATGVGVGEAFAAVLHSRAVGGRCVVGLYWKEGGVRLVTRGL
jgi:hypothetical protein